MAVARSSSSVVICQCHPPSFSSSSGLSVNRFLTWNCKANPCGLSLSNHRHPRSVFVFARGKNRKGFATSSSSSSSKKSKKKSFKGEDNGDGEEEDDDRLAVALELITRKQRSKKGRKE